MRHYLLIQLNLSNANTSSLNHSHVQNPFLLRRDVKALYHSVFSSPGRTNEDETRQSKHDHFRTFMILAIGSVVLYRNNKHRHHPYGYFLSAMKNISPDILSRGVNSIQDLLLVSRFAIYHHIGELPIVMCLLVASHLNLSYLQVHRYGNFCSYVCEFASSWVFRNLRRRRMQEQKEWAYSKNNCIGGSSGNAI